jgi:hypothetical protein
VRESERLSGRNLLDQGPIIAAAAGSRCGSSMIRGGVDVEMITFRTLNYSATM